MDTYQEQGYESREDYLRMLANDYGLTYETVLNIADCIGSDEDFDALPCLLETIEKDKE